VLLSEFFLTLDARWANFARFAYVTTRGETLG